MPIRAARVEDVETVVALIGDLAEYERARDQVRITPDQLRASLFADAPHLFCDVAEVDGALVGVVIWFLNFSTWSGSHGIFVEDLYVRPEHRGEGHGRALLAHLAQICVARGYHRLQWSVLDWNEPALRFYRSLGAVPLDEWTVYRVAHDALGELAALAESPASS